MGSVWSRERAAGLDTGIITAVTSRFSAIDGICQLGYEPDGIRPGGVVEMTPGKRTKVFISYSRKDRRWLKRLQVHLKPLERDGLIERWDDTRITPGNKWREEIQLAIDSAQTAILLVSADFLASDFIAKEELPPLLAAAARDGLKIILVIVGPSLFDVSPLAIWPPVNAPTRPLISLAKSEQEKTLLAVARLFVTKSDPIPRRRSLFRRRWLALAGTLSAVFGLGFARWAATRSEMVLVEGNTFYMGSTEEEIARDLAWCRTLPNADCDEERFHRETPAHTLTVASFNLDRTEVGNASFATWLNEETRLAFHGVVRVVDGRHVEQAGVPLADLYFDPARCPGETSALAYENGRFTVRPGFERAPVVAVTWLGADRYCRAHEKRLPTEAEWELAARGPTRRRFPWGDVEPTCASAVQGRGSGQPCATVASCRLPDVDADVQDRTPTGILALGGSVSEWIADEFSSRYTMSGGGVTTTTKLVETPAASRWRGIRGGYWNNFAEGSRAAARSRALETDTRLELGFRCAQ